MKILKLLLLVIVFILGNSVKSQVTINIGTPPSWGPKGYSDVQYYYIPDVYSYYDVHSSMFIYESEGVWVHRKQLPARYKHYDLHKGYKVVMTDYHGKTPYTNYKKDKVKYAKGYRGPSQKDLGINQGNGNSKPKLNSYGHYNKKYNQSKENDKSQGKSNSKKGNSQGGNKGNKK